MSNIETENKPFLRYAWVAIRYLATLFLGGITIYGTFMQEKKPELKVEIVSDAEVLSKTENISKLHIQYDSTRLDESGQSLRIVTIKIGNPGNASILKTSYDNNAPIIIEFGKARIVEKPNIAASTNEYLFANGSPSVLGENQILIPQLIFDPGYFLTYKVLLLYQIGDTLSYSVRGKIAQVDSICVSRAHIDLNSKSIFERSFGGPLSIQSLRILGYGVVVIILLVAIALIVMYNDERKSRSKRKQLVRLYREYHRNSVPEKFIVELEKYEKEGVGWLGNNDSDIEGLLSGPTPTLLPKKRIERLNEQVRKSNETNPVPASVLESLSRQRQIEGYIQRGYIKVDAGGKLEVDAMMVRAAIDFNRLKKEKRP